MKKLLSAIVATMFAAASFNATAQAKDEKKTEVKSKAGAAVTTKDGKAVAAKGSDPPKEAAKPKTAAAPAKKAKGQNVTTKDAKAVVAKDKKEVTTKGVK